MPQVRDVLSTLERVAPDRFAFPFDKVGLQIGDPNATVTRAAVAMDRSLGAISFASRNGCQLLLTHHPLIFEPLETVDTQSHTGRSALELARYEIAFVAAHTNWDSARGGINDCLAEKFELSNVRDFGTAAEVERLKLVFFCPVENADAVIDAATQAGAGVVGNYTRCAYLSHGEGTFLGNEASSPSVGKPGIEESVSELRVEMVLPKERHVAVAKAVAAAHPYEEPAFDFFVCAPHPEQPAGRLGELSRPLSLQDLVAEADRRLETRSWAWGDPSAPIKKVAIVGGAADGEWMAAQQAGADVLLTGEVKQHVALEASESGIALIASGHYATEHPGSAALWARIAREMPEIEWLLFTPELGLHGRPF